MKGEGRVVLLVLVEWTPCDRTQEHSLSCLVLLVLVD